MLETNRLILRKWQEADFAPFAKMNADSTVMEFFPSTLSRTESDELANKFIKHFEQNGFGLFAATLKDSGEFIGFVGLNIPSFDAHFTPCVEIGWRLAKAQWNKGYATEGALAVIDYGFGELGLEEIVSFTYEGNMASQRVMEKIGMTHDKKDDFAHPKLDKGHRLSKHVLYRKGNF
jgi:3-dehydroquinate dehydratase/shikimate dehydrogenase